jgi:hypothetical protein
METDQLIQESPDQNQLLGESEISNEEPQYITKSDLDALLGDRIEQISAKQFRAFQSMLDKGNKQIQDAINEQLNMLRDAGIEPTQAQEVAIADRVRSRAQDVEPNKTDSITNEQVSDDVQRIYTKYGITLEDTDSEYAMVETNAKTYPEFLSTVTEAVLAKRNRMNAQKAGNRVTALTGISGGVAVGELPSEDYFARAYKK